VKGAPLTLGSKTYVLLLMVWSGIIQLLELVARFLMPQGKQAHPITPIWKVLLFVSPFLIGLGGYMWYAADTLANERKSALGIDGFTESQMAVWRSCNTVHSRLAALEEKLDEFDDTSQSARKNAIRDLAVPKLCNDLLKLRQQNYRKNIKKDAP
jgi:hypothetical protein